MARSIKYHLYLLAFFTCCMIADQMYLPCLKWSLGWSGQSLFEFPIWLIFMATGVVYLAFKSTSFVGCELEKKTYTPSVKFLEKCHSFYVRMFLRSVLALVHSYIAALLLSIMFYYLGCGANMLPVECT